MTEKVNHPKHYGGEANPYETIKVLEARMTPIEVMGFLRGNAYKYNDRAADKGQTEDFKKGRWYQNRMVEFAERVGNDALFPPAVFWDADGVEYPSEDELIACADTNSIITINSSVTPHLRWAINVWGEDDGSETIFFNRFSDAKAFHEGMLEEMAKVARNEKARNRRQNARLKRSKTAKRAKPAKAARTKKARKA